MEYTLDDVICFARQRHLAWAGEPVEDEIVRTRKFTNVFRLLDRGSQYLLELMNEYDETIDRLALSYLYRQVNRPDTMEEIIASNDGYIPNFDDVTNPEWIKDVIWPVIEARPGEFLNGAYIILIMTNDPRSLSDKMADIFPGAKSYLEAVAEEDVLEERVRLLRKTPGLGPFLSMQIATDLGYCKGEPYQENDFILPGPGAKKGAGLIGYKRAEDIITTFPVDQIPNLPYSRGRRASWMDIQNVFCEFGKYVRYKAKPQKNPTEYKNGPKFDIVIPDQHIKSDPTGRYARYKSKR